ncbi:unnamed protein product [Adineta ricciae]|uniref:Uncharacterized protein n=1 Tax=Adineta ricciae TaxID=249248 RepID=A0A814EI22_ADIRI|nr:unnamed protein product [Adineta ricciae]CAF1252626.1 unnamed protein product [Adineta ricciae]
MPTIRLKVQIENNNSSRKSSLTPLKFIYVLDFSLTTTIDELIHLLENYIIRQFSMRNLRLVQLLTDDGYLLSNDQICATVLNDNDRIVCCDMSRFVQENYPTLNLNDLWCEIIQHDASDNLEKRIEVGITNLEKLFIRIYGSSNDYGLYIFNVFQLIKIASEKSQQKQMIARFDHSDWFIEAKWEYDTVSNTVLHLICSMKLGSAEQIWSNKLSLLLDESRMIIEKGDLISLSKPDNDNFTDEQRKILKELASNIPPPQRSGPEIDVDRDRNKSITKHECLGESSIQMAYGGTNTVTTYQDSRLSAEGTFRQNFNITHINFTRKANSTSSEKALTVMKFNILYQTNDGSWCDCEDIAIAPIALRDEEPKWLADSSIQIEPDKLMSIAIKGSIRVKGKPGQDNFQRKRMHRTLPQPLKLKIVIQDNFNKQSSLIVEQLNKPVEYDTSESFIKYNQSSIYQFVAFVYADDCECDERIFMGIYIDNEHQLVITSGNSYSISLGRKNIRTMEYNARQTNTTEMSFDSIYHKDENEEKKAIALFDPKTFILYAIRLEITTRTSKTEQTNLLPLEEIN